MGVTDKNRYREFQNYTGCSELAIFPTELAAESIEEYFYLNCELPLDSLCEIYLKCKYEKATYEEEVERLQSIGNIRLDTMHFQHDAYVSMYNSTYEYALLLPEDNTIVYINTQGIYPNKLAGLRFAKEYLPDDFMKDIEYTGDSRKNFSIY
ncbi:MAG: hypothetical protein K2M46_00500 [Lachnospiraceae bacterium]|nr:hypothetical protein [Lachnospiraceae bacterium]